MSQRRRSKAKSDSQNRCRVASKTGKPLATGTRWVIRITRKKDILKLAAMTACLIGYGIGAGIMSAWTGNVVRLDVAAPYSAFREVPDGVSSVHGAGATPG